MAETSYNQLLIDTAMELLAMNSPAVYVTISGWRILCMYVAVAKSLST